MVGGGGGSKKARSSAALIRETIDLSAEAERFRRAINLDGDDTPKKPHTHIDTHKNKWAT